LRTAGPVGGALYIHEIAMPSPATSIVELRCPSCGQRNRVSVGRLADRPVCGRCKQGLTPAEPVEATDATFDEEVVHSPLPVLVDFWADWCGPCRMVAPVLRDIAKERAGRVKIVKLDVDANPITASRFRVQSIPALKLFRDGRLVDELAGALPKPQLLGWLDRHLGG
jgi:thioredoxin 2